MRACPACVPDLHTRGDIPNPRTRRTYPEPPAITCPSSVPRSPSPPVENFREVHMPGGTDSRANARYRPDPVHSRGLHHHLPTTDRPARSCR